MVPAVTIYSLTFFLGFFGNLLVIFSIFYLKKTAEHNEYVPGEFGER
jgi:hypothetical protein